MRASDDLMGQLHSRLAQEMLEWIENGDLSPQQATAISKFLKDNDITGPVVQGSPLAALAGIIPELTFDDVQEAM